MREQYTEPKLDTPENEELKQPLLLYRNTLDQAAAQTETFWVNQREQVLGRLAPRPKFFQMKRAHLLAAAAVMLFVCFFFFLKKEKLPAPDFAAGADQQLLVEVERALQQPYPDALAPAGILKDEIEAAAKRNLKK
jgi:hypothetical protein